MITLKSKFKFKINQKVYLKNIEHSPFLISDRKIENGEVLYKLSIIITPWITVLDGFKLFINDYICHPLSYKLGMFKLSHWIWNFFIHTKDIPGDEIDMLRTGWTYPESRTDNYIQEDTLDAKPITHEPVTCSYNGCELLTEYLNN